MQGVTLHPGGAFGTAFGYGGVFDVTYQSPGPPAIVEGHSPSGVYAQDLFFDPSGLSSYALLGNALQRLFVADTDIWPPKVTATIPGEGGDWPVGAEHYTLYLNEPMNLSTITSSTVTVDKIVNNNPQPVAGTITTKHLGTVVEWIPSAALSTGTYTLHLTGLEDEAHNPMVPRVFHFGVQ